MLKHFVWLVLLSGCGAGGVGTAGVSGGGGNPDVQGEWVSGAFSDGSLTGSVNVLKLDSLGRLVAHALRIETAGIPGVIQPSVTWSIADYVSKTIKESSPGGFNTFVAGRSVTTWNGSNVVVDIFGPTGNLVSRWELSVRESFNLGVSLSGTFSSGGFTGNLSFQNAAVLCLSPVAR